MRKVGKLFGDDVISTFNVIILSSCNEKEVCSKFRAEKNCRKNDKSTAQQPLERHRPAGYYTTDDFAQFVIFFVVEERPSKASADFSFYEDCRPKQGTLSWSLKYFVFIFLIISVCLFLLP